MGIDVSGLYVESDLPTDALDLALFWAERGFPVLPTRPDTKAPWLGKGWQSKATNDAAVIRRWPEWGQGARVGIKTGLACGCGCLDGPDVLDFDVWEKGNAKRAARPKPGLEQLRKLIEANVVDVSRSLVVRTASPRPTDGEYGRHWYFQGSQQHNSQNDDRVAGVDLRAHHGMVIAPGNPGYPIQNLFPVELGPVDWDRVVSVLAPAAPPSNPPVVSGQQDAIRPTAAPSRSAAPKSRLVAPLSTMEPTDEGSAAWFCRNHPIGPMLQARGWDLIAEANGKQEWRRPGKQDLGTSATLDVGLNGREMLRIWTSSTELDQDRTYDAFELHAAWEFRGDKQAAGRAVRGQMAPRPVPAVRLGAPVPNADGARALTPPPPIPVAGDGSSEVEPEAGGEEPANLPVLAEAEPPQVRDFWKQRPVFAQLLWLARERRVSPWAVLGAVLAHVSCRIGPHVVLPPTVGGVASLNLLVGLVGPSGQGKGAASAVAQAFLGYDETGTPYPVEKLGTGQGVDASFTEATKAGAVQYNDVALFEVPEIDTIAAHQAMAGSTLLSTLREVYSGERLGAQYANKEKRRPVRAHAYRASVIAGIQPRRSKVLLEDADGGTPQRWLWMPTTDPGRLKRTDRLKPPLYVGEPPRIDMDVWVPIGEVRGEKGEPEAVEMKPRWVVGVCDTAVNTIVDAREEALAGNRRSLDSHGLLTRLKVAALLAFLDRRSDVTDEDWELAFSVMLKSNQTRRECQAELSEAAKEEAIEAGKKRATSNHTANIAAVTLKNEHDDEVARYGMKALGVLEAASPEWLSPRDLTIKTMDAKKAALYKEDVFAALRADPRAEEGPEIARGGRKVRMWRWRQGIVPLPVTS